MLKNYKHETQNLKMLLANSERKSKLHLYF